MKNLTVEEADRNKRLDVFVAENLTDISRAYIQKLCDMNRIKVNGTSEPPKRRLKPSDNVSVELDPDDASQPESIQLPIVYEDDDCMVIDKSTGVLTHSKGAFNPEPTVATFIRPKLSGLSGERAGIVHRLDRGTSGLIICAKNSDSQKWLQKQFSSRKVKKSYIAIIEGRLKPPAAIIDMPIDRNPKKPQSFIVGDSGRPATTEYSTIKSGDKYSMVELRPKTGRTHQLRVHLKHLGHPIVGDELYGGAEADRLYLHASELEITLPSKERKVFKSNLPQDFNRMMS